MVGMEVGTERAIPLTLPSNWMPEELAGAAVTAQVKVRELLFWQLPEKVDDAWAEAAYPGSETVAGLKRRLREAVAADVESKTSAKVQEAITTMLAEAVDAAVDWVLAPSNARRVDAMRAAAQKVVHDRHLSEHVIRSHQYRRPGTIMEPEALNQSSSLNLDDPTEALGETPGNNDDDDDNDSNNGGLAE